MLNWPAISFAVSALGLLVLAGRSLLASYNLRRFLVQLAVIALSSLVFFQLFQPGSGATAKTNTRSEAWFMLLLFLSMVAGMASHYCYHLLSEGKQRRPAFDLGLLIAPVFASPIVFLPLFTAFQNADFDKTHEGVARLSLLFVAFQNGFFWKDYFDNHHKQTGYANTRTPPPPIKKPTP